MEAHPECSMCFHPVDVLYEDGRPPRVYPPAGMLPPEKTIFDLTDLAAGNLLQTNSVLYRWRFTEGLPAWFNPTLLQGDWYRHLLHAERGKIGYIDERMAVYRRHADSLYAAAEEDQRTHRVKHGIEELSAYVAYDQHFNGRFKKIFRDLAYGVLATLLQEYMENGNRAPFEEVSEKFPEVVREFLAHLQL